MSDAVLTEPLEGLLLQTRDNLAALNKTIDRMDHAQNALLENGHSLQSQIEVISGLLNHLIQILTPEQPAQEGPSLGDLLARLITQQSALAGLMKQNLEIVTRLDRREAAGQNASAPAGRA